MAHLSAGLCRIDPGFRPGVPLYDPIVKLVQPSPSPQEHRDQYTHGKKSQETR